MSTQPNGPERRDDASLSPAIDDDLPIVKRFQDQGAGKKAAVGVLSAVAAYLLTRNYPAVGLFLVLMLASGALGALLGKKMLRSRASLRAVLAWGGLLLWLLPFVGVFGSGAVWAGQEVARPLVRERLLAIACLVLALINGALGTLGVGR